MPGLGALHPYRLSMQFEAWQRLLRTPIDWDPTARASWVCAVYGVSSPVAAYVLFVRR